MRTARFVQASVLALVSLALAATQLSADQLDPTFGSAGKVLTDVSGGYDELRALAIQPDGRIVAAGVTGTVPNRDFALARYNADGTLDRSFGVNGTVITDFRRGDDTAWALSLQSDGKIIVAGGSDGDFAVARYKANGTLDDRFGDSGKATLDLGGDDRALAVAIQGDGKILAAGTAVGRHFAIARFETDGSPDVTFGRNGRLVTGFSEETGAAFAVAAGSGGKIVAAGSTGAFPAERFAVAQYTADGTLDDEFGAGGKPVVDFGRSAGAHGLAFQDGAIVVSGYMDRGSSRDGVFARLTAAGALDPSFGVGGRVFSDFGGRNFASAVMLQSDGRCIVAGS